MPMGKYDSLRKQNDFSWTVLGNVYTLMEYEQISLYEYYTDVKANIHLYRVGRPKLLEVFGEDIQMPSISTPHISYGHISGLGAPLRFPKDGEVAVDHMFGSLTEAVAHLQKQENVDYAKTGIAPMYMEMRGKLQEAFPGEPVNYGASGQGPITTAYLLNGEQIYYELYDNPDLLLTYLELITRSENTYLAFVQRDILGKNPLDYRYMADDSAAFISPELFPTFVLPFWEKQYLARTTGNRDIHCEGLRVSQLGFLEAIGVDSYDPSVSPLLTPKLISNNCRIPFDWRLVSFHLWNMTVQQVRDFVFHMVADGASGTYLVLTENMSEGENLKKVFAYIDACKESVKVLQSGGNREDVRTMAQVKSGDTFWNSWLGYKGKEAVK